VDAPGRDGGRLLEPREAAWRLGVKPKTLRLWHAAGLIGARRTAGGQRRYRESDVADLAAKFDEAVA
jgi:excisionase family DNA binding protein